MQATRSPYGLCSECLANSSLSMIGPKKPHTCINCQKQPDILFNRDPYCHLCYIQTISSPMKSEMTSQRETKMKSFYKTIDREEVESMKKAFFSKKIISKISKVFDDSENQSQLLAHLNKKATALTNIEWDKFVQKINKVSNVVYIFIGKQKIIGSFHTQSVVVEGETKFEDTQAGIFSTNRQTFNLEFARVKSNWVTYSPKAKSIRFGNPSSFEIEFGKNLKITSELTSEFEVLNAFLYKF